MRVRRFVLALFVALALPLPSSVLAQEAAVWEITQDRLNAIASPTILFRGPGGQTLDTLPAADVKVLREVYDRIGAVTGFTGARLIISHDASLNASAGRAKDGTPVVMFTTGMMKLLRGDPDMTAAIMAHEFGHQVLGHKGYAATTQAIDAATTLLSILIGGTRANTTAKTLGAIGGSLAIQGGIRSFDRDREREADAFGVEHMIRGGFSSEGAARLWADPRMQGGGWLSTHPPSAERLANVRELGARFAHLAPSQTTTVAGSTATSPPTDQSVVTVAESGAESASPALQPRSSLLQIVRCKLPDDTTVSVTRIECARQSGTPE